MKLWTDTISIKCFEARNMGKHTNGRDISSILISCIDSRVRVNDGAVTPQTGFCIAFWWGQRRYPGWLAFVFGVFSAKLPRIIINELSSVHEPTWSIVG